MADRSVTDTSQFRIPADLVRESHRAAKPKNEQLRVDHFKVSWLTRLSEKLVGRD